MSHIILGAHINFNSSLCPSKVQYKLQINSVNNLQLSREPKSASWVSNKHGDY